MQAGEEVVISNRGKPVARLVAENAEPAPRYKPGTAAAILDYLDTRPPRQGPRLSPQGINALIEDNRNAWE